MAGSDAGCIDRSRFATNTVKLPRIAPVRFERSIDAAVVACDVTTHPQYAVVTIAAPSRVVKTWALDNETFGATRISTGALPCRYRTSATSLPRRMVTLTVVPPVETLPVVTPSTTSTGLPLASVDHTASEDGP